jgi:hypothetical protein
MASTRNGENGETAKPKRRPRYSWTQPVCKTCWNGLQLKTGRPTAGTAICCFCNRDISEGDPVFLLRVNPGSVPYPSNLKEDE